MPQLFVLLRIERGCAGRAIELMFGVGNKRLLFERPENLKQSDVGCVRKTVNVFWKLNSFWIIKWCEVSWETGGIRNGGIEIW